MLPKDTPEGVSLRSPIKLRFNEQVMAGSTNTTIWITPSTFGPVIAIEVDNSKLIGIASEAPYDVVMFSKRDWFVSALSTQTYTIAINDGAFEDMSGNPVVSFTHTFTVVDAVGPSLIATDPPNKHSRVLKQMPIVFYFDQPINIGNGTILLTSMNQDPVELWTFTAGDDRMQIVGSTMTIVPHPAMLLAGQSSAQYKVVVGTNSVIDTAATPNDAILVESQVLQFTVINAFQNVKISSSERAAGLETKLSVAFDTLAEIVNFDSVVLNLPRNIMHNHGYKFTPQALQQNFKLVEPSNNLCFVFGDSSSNQIIFQKIGGQTILAETKVLFEVSGIQLPRIIGDSGMFKLETMDASGRIGDLLASISGPALINELPPVFDDDKKFYSIVETNIYEECGQPIIVLRKGQHQPTVGTCPPSGVTPARAYIGKLSVSNPDWIPNEQTSYHFIGGNELNLFDLDTNTGEIYSTGLLNAEAITGPHVLRAEARDNTEPYYVSEAYIYIDVLDFNDHSPVFISGKLNYIDVVAHESSTEVGSIIAMVSATDGDAGVNSQLEYYLGDAKLGEFAIHRLTGEISLLNPTALISQQFYVYAKDSPLRPTEPRIGKVLLNLLVLTAENVATESLRFFPGKTFALESSVAQMNARLCGDGSCSVEVWNAPGVVNGMTEFVASTSSNNEAFTGDVQVEYFVRSNAEKTDSVVVRQQVSLRVQGASVAYIEEANFAETVKASAANTLANTGMILENQIFEVILKGDPSDPSNAFSFVFVLVNSISRTEATMLVQAINNLAFALLFNKIPLGIPAPDVNRDRRTHLPLTVYVAGQMKIEAPVVSYVNETPDLSSTTVFSVNQIEAILFDIASKSSKGAGGTEGETIDGTAVGGRTAGEMVSETLNQGVSNIDFVSTGLIFPDDVNQEEEDDEGRDEEYPLHPLTVAGSAVVISSTLLVTVALFLVAIWCCCRERLCGCCCRNAKKKSVQRQSMAQHPEKIWSTSQVLAPEQPLPWSPIATEFTDSPMQSSWIDGTSAWMPYFDRNTAANPQLNSYDRNALEVLMENEKAFFGKQFQNELHDQHHYFGEQAVSVGQHSYAVHALDAQAHNGQQDYHNESFSYTDDEYIDASQRYVERAIM
jgi:hypothetical protein